MNNKEIYFDLPIKKVCLDNYKHIISLGNKCCTALCLRSLNLYKESYPFDWVPTQPFLVLKYIQDNSFFMPEKGKIRNIDGVWLGHFDINNKYEDTVLKFERRFKRLLNILINKEPFLLVYTSEADVYNEMNSFYNNNYEGLVNLQNYILSINPSANFKIIAIHTNKAYEDTDYIVNYTLNVNSKHISLNMETHVSNTWIPYRAAVKDMLCNILTD